MIKKEKMHKCYPIKISPTKKKEMVAFYEVEPYVYCQNILGKEHPQFGLGRNSWLTGTAAWAYVSWIQYVLGIRGDYNGLVIDPCIPSKWNGFEAVKTFRDAIYKITVKNPNGVEKGVTKIVVDGKEIADKIVPIFGDKKEHTVEVTLG